MLPRILCHSSGIVRRTRRHHSALLFGGVVRPQARCLQPVVTPLVSTLRNLSSNTNDSSSKSTSSSLLDAEKAIAKDAKVKKESIIAGSDSSTTAPSIDTGNQKSQQPLSTPPVSSTIPSTQTSSSTTLPTTATPASAVSNNPKETVTDAPSTPSTGESPTPLVPQMKSDTVEGGALANVFDKAFRLWSERSGTSEIFALKESVNDAGAVFDTSSAVVTTNRRTLDEALRKWERASGQHLQLLQRRESWTPEDAQRFADFVSLEITSRGELEQARHDLGRSEELLTRSQLDYINKMRRRYHEEQIWQDQWRVLGTYGTWTLICLNSCVFMGSQFFQGRRERIRTEKIERWILESKSDRIRNDGQNAGVEIEASEIPATAAVIENSNADKNDVNRTEIEEHIVESKEELVTAKGEEELRSDDPSIIERNDTVKTEGHEANRRLYPAMERIGAAAASVGSFVNRWEHKLRSNAKELAVSMNQKLHQTLPSNIANEIPKSVSEIHVPSAVIGASVGGIAALTISMIFSAFSNRRY